MWGGRKEFIYIKTLLTSALQQAVGIFALHQLAAFEIMNRKN